MQDKRRFIPFCAGNAERRVPLWSSEILSSRELHVILSWCRNLCPIRPMLSYNWIDSLRSVCDLRKDGHGTESTIRRTLPAVNHLPSCRTASQLGEIDLLQT